MVRGDVRALERVAANLISNAVKFTPDGGVVSTAGRGRRRPRRVLLVSDTGIGIPEHDQEHLFTRFFRAAGRHRAGDPGQRPRA